MNFEHCKQTTLSAFQLFIALVVLLSVSLSLTSEVFANQCDESCHSESRESNQDCDACLCCPPVIKVFVPAEFESGAFRGPISMAECSGSINKISSPPIDIDHPPQNLQ